MGKKHVALVLIHKRNIACSYCYEHSKDAASMPLEVAKQVLSAELNAKNDFDPLDIDLFGGEPFMAFDVIDSIVSFLRNGTFEKSWSLPTIANGTALADKMKGRLTKTAISSNVFLATTARVTCSASTAAHRQPISLTCRFSQRPFPVNRSRWPSLGRRYPVLPKAPSFLHEKGFLVNNSLANSINWLEGSQVGIGPVQPETRRGEGSVGLHTGH